MTFVNGILIAVLLQLIKHLFIYSNITICEVIYAKNAFSTIIIFIYCLLKGIPIFDLEEGKRAFVFVRGMLILIG